MRVKFIYEKFEEDSDPIHNLGIGIEKYRESLRKHRAISRLLGIRPKEINERQNF
jgi:hypothetical protein